MSRLFVVVLLALAACSAPIATPVTHTQAAAPVTATSQAATTDATDPTGMSNNGWKITTFTMKADGAGNWGANARMTNATGADKKAAAFTVTVLDASKNVVTTLVGSATSVAKDATVTVQLVSLDKYTTGTYLYAFQVDASY